jgi:hypothetical protein
LFLLLEGRVSASGSTVAICKRIDSSFQYLFTFQ